MKTAPITLSADVEILAAAAESKGPRSFSVKAYNGGELRVKGYHLPVVLDLAGSKPARSIVANLHHNSTAIVGHATDVVNDGKTLTLGGKVSGTGPAAQEFLANHDNGFPWQASIEASPSKVVEIPEGKTATANGRTFAGPVLIARKSSLFGLGFVPRGADEDTHVTVAASAADHDPKGTDMDFEKWILALGFDAENQPTDKQRAALKGKYDAEIKAAASPDAVTVPEFDLDEIKAAASEHVATLEAHFAESESEIYDGRKFAEIKSKAIKAARDLKAKAIREKWSATKYEVDAIRSIGDVRVQIIEAKTPGGPNIISKGSHDTSAPVIEAALCQSRGIPDHEKGFKAEVLDKANTQYRGRLGLQQTLIMAAAQNGYPVGHGERIHAGNLRPILAHALPPIHASSTSTVSLSGILSNVATKELLAGYMGGDQTWQEIAVTKSVSDFKQITSYRLLDSMEYEKLSPEGHIAHGSVGSESYTRQADTYAKMFSLTRRDIINDDLGAFDDLRTRLGAGARKKFNNIFWTAFLASHSTFFTTTRRNYITGSTTTLLTDGVGLGLALKAFRQMRTPNAEGSFTAEGSEPLGGRPTILLVPPELEAAADHLYTDGNLNVGSGPGEGNIYRNKYRPVVNPWLSDSNFTGYSTTAWYLLRPKEEAPMMNVSFLNGVQSPTVESADADFDMLGVQFRGYHDFGCDQAEYLCGIKSKGAA